MWLDQHPFLLFYIVGCGLVLALTLFKLVFFWSINWIIRANVLQRNVMKLAPPVDTTFSERCTKVFAVVIFEALLSWINVVVIIWQIVATTFGILRDQLQPAPEAIKLLRFPLRNNPDMSRESVWAYCHSLGIRAGQEIPSKETLLKSLYEISGYYPDFDKSLALRQLESLEAVDSLTIAESLNEVLIRGSEI